MLAMLPTLLAGTALWWWFGELFCHFRLQYLCILLPLMAFYAARRRWRMTAALVAAQAVNLSLIVPLYFGDPSSSSISKGTSVRLISANVFVGNHNSQPVVDLIRNEQPDIVLTIEVNPDWLHALEALKGDYPHVVSAMRTEGYGGFDPFGMALFSRKATSHSEVRRVGVQGLPVIVAALDVNGASFTVIGAHPYPPVTRSCAAIRNEYLAGVADIVASVDGPCVLMGDLNTTSWSPVFVSFVKRSGLRDTEARVRNSTYVARRKPPAAHPH